ncbi:MAG TPA: phosphomannomutase/phosphoglucomutase, partial [Ruminococcaceae bacterium]|nr:phosphomannomutase/phosphoglucomutase [Oscillospiraceae bacterium]
LEAYAEEHHWQLAPDNREGLRVSFPKENGDGWFLLRLSVHDPIMPLNVESDSKGGVARILDQLTPFLKTCRELDLSPLGQKKP